MKPPRRIRLAIAFVDCLIILIINLGLSLLLSQSGYDPALQEPTKLGSREGLFLITFLGYYVFFEGLLGRTVGKFFTGTKVVRRSDPRKIGLGLAFLRAIVRLIPLEWITILTWRRLCLHDLLTGTRVVRPIK